MTDATPKADTQADAPGSNEETLALLSLLLTPGLGPTLVGRCLDTFGSAGATLAASGAQLGGIRGISPSRASELKRKIDGVLRNHEPDRELDAAHTAGVRLIRRDDSAYPKLLSHIPDPPPLLWVRGELRDDDALSLGIVGSRRCSHYGQEQADRFAAQAAAAGLCVVSGGAYGIDAAAHRATLRVKGRTVAVIGSGLGNPYPQDHAPLFDQIVAEDRGVVVSELPMSIGPKPENFPRRNRIISGLSLGVLVVEAAKRSGALITARLCVEEHGRECMALPGRIDAPGSAGCHHLIRSGGATLVTGITDVLDQLGEAGELLKTGLNTDATAPPVGHQRNTPEAAPPPLDATLTEPQRTIAEALTEPRSLDQLIAWTGLGAGAARAELTMLEVRGV
ncbi:MAG: DNA-processing protein DprA, partial [Planctomycetota bacterium]